MPFDLRAFLIGSTLAKRAGNESQAAKWGVFQGLLGVSMPMILVTQEMARREVPAVAVPLLPEPDPYEAFKAAVKALWAQIQQDCPDATNKFSEFLVSNKDALTGCCAGCEELEKLIESMYDELELPEPQ